MKIGSPSSIVSTYIYFFTFSKKVRSKVVKTVLDSQHFDREHEKLKVLHIFSRRQYILLVTSKDQQSNTKLEFNDFRPEKQFPSSEGTRSAKISYHHLIEGSIGKPGFVSFYRPAKINEYEIIFVGPTVIVASFVFSSLYLIRILSAMLENYPIPDLVLDFTGAIFYCGVAGFLFLIKLWRSVCVESNHDSAFPLGHIALLVLCLIIPMGFLWPWISHAASTPLNPYLVGILVLHAFDLYKKIFGSPSWPAIYMKIRDWILLILQFIFL